MNRQIIIGKNGEQKFPITNAGVSRHHARITITDNGWLLEDLNSTNGTYVRDENGNFERVLSKRIHEDTVIRLGDSSINGYTFWAHHVLEENPNDYGYEFTRISEFHKNLSEEKRYWVRRCQRKIRNTRILVTLSGPLLFLTLASIFKINMGYIIVACITGALQQLVPQKINTDQIDNKIKSMLVCPRCGRPLSEYEIKSQQCMACKSHS